MENSLEFIAALSLKAPLAASNRAIFRDVMEPAVQDLSFDKSKDQSFLSDKSALSFVSGVSEQNRTDVVQSTLLAQLAANKQFPDSSGSMEWCNVFASVLSNIGWVIEGTGVSTYQMKGNIFAVNTAILEILVAAFGQDYLSIIKTTIDSMRNLSDQDNRIRVFEKNTHSLSKGFFQVGLVSEQNNAVSLQLGAFFISSSERIDNILFFSSSKESSTLDYFSRKATFSPDIYKNIRQAVSNKLGTAVMKYVDQIDISL
ncbi:MAG: hypothetical protein ABIN89_07715 [Chitinophagaceae bacterium]